MRIRSYITMGLLGAALTLGGCAQMGGQDAGWITLFDGTSASLANWDRLGGANWRIEDGAVVADGSTSKGASFLVSKKSYADFELRVEFWVSDDANSGIFLRCRNAKKIADTLCYEANIFDQRSDPAFGTGGIVYFAAVPVPPIYKAGGKWNTYEITAKGTHLTVVLNGQRTVELNNKKYKSGPLALQYGKGVVKFRKVQIRPL